MWKWMTAVVLGASFCCAIPARAQWHIGADFMLPSRHTTSDVPFARTEISGSRVGDVVRLSEEDLDLDLTAGGRITIGNRSGMFGIEGSYVGTTEWSETGSAFDSTGNLVSPFSRTTGAPVDPIFDNNTSIIVDYTSQLHTADVNLTQNVYSGMNGSVFVLCGARYLSIEEQLNYASDNAVADHTIFTATDNRMFGPQLGVGIESPFGASLFNLTFKSTLAYNSVDKTTIFDGTPGEGSDQDASFISEIGVDCVLVPTSNVSVRLGWYFLAATDIALASDNFELNPTVLSSGIANVRSERKVFYHSPYIGVVVAY